MSDFLRGLAERSLRRASGVRPRVLPLFASNEPPIKSNWEAVVRQDWRDPASAVRTRESEPARVADFESQEEEFAKGRETDEAARSLTFRLEDSSPEKCTEERREIVELPVPIETEFRPAEQESQEEEFAKGSETDEAARPLTFRLEDSSPEKYTKQRREIVELPVPIETEFRPAEQPRFSVPQQAALSSPAAATARPEGKAEATHSDRPRPAQRMEFEPEPPDPSPPFIGLGEAVSAYEPKPVPDLWAGDDELALPSHPRRTTVHAQQTVAASRTIDLRTIDLRTGDIAQPDAHEVERAGNNGHAEFGKVTPVRGKSRQQRRSETRERVTGVDPISVADVYVTIGRVDVRATTAPLQDKAQAATRALPLAEYLKRRDASGGL